MSGGSRVTKTETSPWGVMPGAEGDTFEFGGQEYLTSDYPQGMGQLPALVGAFGAARNLYDVGQYAPHIFHHRHMQGLILLNRQHKRLSLGMLLVEYQMH
tara:strand:- start:1513 stop:1812 length:300 start_codon:yes stop_codon:yes gene_type:complete